MNDWSSCITSWPRHLRSSEHLRRKSFAWKTGASGRLRRKKFAKPRFVQTELWQFEVVCNPILNLWTWPGGNALGRSTDHGCCLSWWQSCPILFHRFTEHARMKGDHFSNLILTLAITMIIIPATTTTTIVITIIVVVVIIIWTLTPAYAPLHPKFAATEQNCKLVYQPRFHSMIHCIETRGGEDDSFDQVLSQTEQTESTEHCSWAYCQLTINAQNSQGTCTALASGLVLFGSRPGMPNIESIHGVSQHIDPQVVKSEATHMTGPGSLSLQIIHWFFALQREHDHHSKRNIPNKYAACFHMKY